MPQANSADSIQSGGQPRSRVLAGFQDAGTHGDQATLDVLMSLVLRSHFLQRPT